MNTHDIELPEHDCLYESTNEQGYIDLEPAYRKTTVLKLIEADRERRCEPDACGFLPVKKSAIDWLKKHYPALCEKSGLCERVGGRLYTITKLADQQPADPVVKDSLTDADPVRHPYPVEVYAWGGTSGYHDYVMSDGSIQTLKGDEAKVLFGGKQSAEPVKVPSDAQPLLDMIETLCNGLEWNIDNHPEAMNESDAEALAEACALLDRYGQPAQPDAIAWICEDELPSNYPYEAMFQYSKVDVVRLFPVFCPAPTPAITGGLE